jgi:hypothetical protein
VATLKALALFVAVALLGLGTLTLFAVVGAKVGALGAP